MNHIEEAKFVLRLPPVLHRKIKRRAKANNTSMNREITNILRDAVVEVSTRETLDTLIARLEKKRVI